MCLTTRQKYPITLDKDMIVYKKVIIDEETNTVISSVMNFRYTFNTLYVVIMGISTNISVFNSAISKITKESITVVINKGFHFYTTIESVIRFNWDASYYYIVECTIPAGSILYYDETGLCVSNNIIINKIIQ